MCAAGATHVVLLKNDGSAMRLHFRPWGIQQIELAVPALPAGVTYTQVAAGLGHTLLLRSNGTAVAIGPWGAAPVPLPPPPRTYVQVATGNNYFYVLLQDDGTVVVHNATGLQHRVPDLPAGMRYTQIAVATCRSISAIGPHAVLLRSDGNVVSTWPPHILPPALPPGMVYTRVEAAEGRSLLIRSDGAAIAFGFARYETMVPDLPPGLRYTRVTGGSFHTVFLRSDGMALATGCNICGQCDIPALPVGLTYTHVTAGLWFTVILRSDGAAVSCGAWAWTGPRFPPLGPRFPLLSAGQKYVADCYPTLFMLAVYDGGVMRLMTLGGVERWSIRAAPSALLADVYNQLSADCRSGLLGLAVRQIDATLPAGGLLSGASPSETIAAAWGLRPRRARGKRPREAYWGA